MPIALTRSVLKGDETMFCSRCRSQAGSAVRRVRVGDGMVSAYTALIPSLKGTVADRLQGSTFAHDPKHLGMPVPG